MPGWIRSAAVRLAVALVATLGLLLAPTGTSAAHGVAGHGTHHGPPGQMADMLDHGHDHDHDDAVEDEERSAHPKHNPADHGHMTVGTVAEVVVDCPPIGRQWRSACPASELPCPAAGFERPPRPIVHA